MVKARGSAGRRGHPTAKSTLIKRKDATKVKKIVKKIVKGKRKSACSRKQCPACGLTIRSQNHSSICEKRKSFKAFRKAARRKAPTLGQSYIELSSDGVKRTAEGISPSTVAFNVPVCASVASLEALLRGEHLESSASSSGGSSSNSSK